MTSIKIYRLSIFIFLLSFTLLNLFTISIESPLDGNNLIGFPVRFYEYLGGKRFPEPDSRTIFNFINFSIDFLLIGIASIAVGSLVYKNKSVK